MKTTKKRRYRPTESKYKGKAQQMYVTYDLEQKTRGGGTALYPKVKRVYIAGNLKDWKVGDFPKRSGREVHGVKIQYEQSREKYRRKSYTATRGETEYQVSAAKVPVTAQQFVQVVEVPRAAHHVRFHSDANSLPEKYRHALQDVR